MEQPTKQQKIENRIFTIRGTQVMIDRELVTNCDRLENMKHASAMPYAFTELETDQKFEQVFKACSCWPSSRP